jgi:hypothetical protein
MLDTFGSVQVLIEGLDLLKKTFGVWRSECVRIDANKVLRRTFAVVRNLGTLNLENLDGEAAGARDVIGEQIPWIGRETHNDRL